MSIIKLSAPLLKAVGKIFGGADWWLMERYGTKYTAHKNHPRLSVPKMLGETVVLDVGTKSFVDHSNEMGMRTNVSN